MKKSTHWLQRWALLLAPLSVMTAGTAVGQAVKPAPDLSVRYDELTAPDFVRAVAKSDGVCLVPVGIMEKHGPHLPLGTDLFDCREVSLRAARQEYSIVFPEYFVGQIFEARHQPGTMAYSVHLMLELLQETCDELARNGIKKVILVNGHGGNDELLHFFCQAQLASRKDYVVYLFERGYGGTPASRNTTAAPGAPGRMSSANSSSNLKRAFLWI